MQPNEITEVLNRPISQELLARDVTRLAYVAKDGTPRNVPIAFTWNGSEIVMCTSKNAPKLQALSENPMVALTIDTEVHRPDLAHPGSGRAGLRRWHPGRVSPGDQHLRDDARATGRVGGGGAFALPRRHGPDRRDPELGEADRLRDDSAERGRGTGPTAGGASARLSTARSLALSDRPRPNPTGAHGVCEVRQEMSRRDVENPLAAPSPE